MPKEVKDIKKFLEIARRSDATAARIKKTQKRTPGAQSTTKFKIRCSRHLYTLIVKDAEKADKLRQSLPPTLKVEEVDAKSKPKKK